jgi:hypothetical protein
MANTAAAIVDRVLPDNVPVRQYVLTLPYELRRLAAFKADVLTAIGRIAVEAIFASYRARAKRNAIEDGQCGAINFVQRCGSSVNLNVHFHVALLRAPCRSHSVACPAMPSHTCPATTVAHMVVAARDATDMRCTRIFKVRRAGIRREGPRRRRVLRH